MKDRRLPVALALLGALAAALLPGAPVAEAQVPTALVTLDLSSSPATVPVGQQATFTVKVSNQSGQELSVLWSVVLTLPDGVEFVSATGSGVSAAGGSVLWVGSFPVGATELQAVAKVTLPHTASERAAIVCIRDPANAPVGCRTLATTGLGT